jgi:hypothetical protein
MKFYGRCMVWILKVPNNVKMFIWRANQNILPTKDNLYLWKVIIENVAQYVGGKPNLLGIYYELVLRRKTYGGVE